MKGKKVQKFTNVLFYACAILLGASLVMRFSSDLPGASAFFALSLIGFTIFHFIRLIKFGVRKRATYHWAYSIVFILMAVVLFAKYLYRFFGHYLGIVVIPLFGLMALHYLMAEKERDRRTSILMGAYFLLAIPFFTPQFKESPLSYIPWWIEMGSTVEQERFENGQLKEQVGVRSGMKHGSYRTFYQNGQIKEKGWYVDGMRNGTFREYYEKGKLKNKGRYEAGEREGEHIWLESDGDTIEVVNYKNNTLYGLTKKYFENGELKFRRRYKNGVRVGVEKSFYKDGDKRGVTDYSETNKTRVSDFFYNGGGIKMKNIAIRDCVIYHQKYDESGDTVETGRALVIIGPDTLKSSEEKYKANVYFGYVEDTSLSFKLHILSSKDEGPHRFDFAVDKEDTVQIKNGVGSIEFVPDSPVLPHYHFTINEDYKGDACLGQKDIYVEEGDVENYKAYYKDSKEGSNGD